MRQDRSVSDAATSQPDWIRSIRAGQFDAIPNAFSWDISHDFAHLINGYTLSQEAGLGPLGHFANARIDEAQETGHWSGTGLELWCCLFFEHRRYRHMGEGDPTDSDLDLLNRLCTRLRLRLSTVTDEERQTLLIALQQD